MEGRGREQVGDDRPRPGARGGTGRRSTPTPADEPGVSPASAAEARPPRPGVLSEQQDLAREGSSEELRAALRDAQQRLSYYERFEAQLQEHTDAVVARATQAARDLERELREQVHDLREERDLREQIHSLRDERDRLLVEAAAAREEMERQRAQAALFVAKIEEQTSEILSSLRRAAETISGHPAEQLGGARDLPAGGHQAQAASSAPAADPSTPPASAAESGRGDRDGETGEAEPGPLKPAPRPAAGPDTVETQESLRPAAAVGMDEANRTVTTQLMVRPAPGPDRLARCRQALEALPSIARTEVGGEAGALLVTHAIRTSLLSALLAIPDLDFRLVALDDDFIEIEIIETSAP